MRGCGPIGEGRILFLHHVYAYEYSTMVAETRVLMQCHFVMRGWCGPDEGFEEKSPRAAAFDILYAVGP